MTDQEILVMPEKRGKEIGDGNVTQIYRSI